MLFCSLTMTSSSLVMIGSVGDEIWPKAAGGTCARAAMVRVFYFVPDGVCITLRYTPRYGAETTYSRLRVFCSNGDVSRHFVNSGGVR